MERFKTLKDHVYEYIEEQIMKGTLLPGERINENTICEELGISRTPVREALIQLTAEGVLETKARKGFVIKAVQEKEVIELYAVIGILDGFAAQLACPALTEKDFADLDFYVEAMDLAIKTGNFEMYRKQQALFHQFYIDRCGNSVLITALSRVKSKLFQNLIRMTRKAKCVRFSMPQIRITGRLSSCFAPTTRRVCFVSFRKCIGRRFTRHMTSSYSVAPRGFTPKYKTTIQTLS